MVKLNPDEKPDESDVERACVVVARWMMAIGFIGIWIAMAFAMVNVVFRVIEAFPK